MSISTLFGQVSPYYNYDYHYNMPDHVSGAAMAGVLVFAILFGLFVAAAVYVIHAFLLSRIFKKAGVKEWKAWVPVYNNWVMLELGGQQGFWAVLAFIPIVNIASAVFMYIAMYHIGLRLGKEGAFVLLAIFLPIVWYIWLAVDSSKWKPDHAAKSAAK